MNSLEHDASTVVQEIDETLKRLDTTQILSALDCIMAARRVFVIGVGREGLAARGFAMRLMHSGLDVHWGWDETTPAVTKDDVLVMVNGSGRIGHLDYVFDRVRSTGAATVVMTGVPEAPTPSAADVAVQVPATVYLGEGHLVESIQPLGALFEQSLFILFDLMILQLVRRLDMKFPELALRHRNFE